MNIVSGVVPADSGEMLWSGEPARPESPRQAQEMGIAFVHQELALVPQLSAAENIFLGRHPADKGWVRWREIHQRARELLAELGCAVDVRRPAGDLSLAGRQLVEIARALAFQARLIIMDEPTAPLAEQEAESLFRTIDRLRARGVSVIFISHRLKEIFRIADRVTVLRDGRHVLTAEASAMDEDGLVRAMAGSELKQYEHEPAAERNPAEAIRIEGDVALTVRRGEIVGLAGLAGAGRTELLEAIFGAGDHYHLTVFIDGRELKVKTPRDAVRGGLALVPDDRKGKGLVLGASLGTNIVLATRARLNKEEAGRLVAELRIKTAGLDQQVRYLSGGNQQKAVLAKWLYAGATVFLLDEPTRGIDVRSKTEIYELVRAVAERGGAVLVASSEADELLRLADRIVVMHRGRIAGELDREGATEERILQLATGGAA
jgi:ribose transport system ATP-binding protein